MKVGLFVTCLVDFFRPQIAFASLKLLEYAKCTVIVPLEQTCCGQPTYNIGDKKNTQRIAKNVISLFEDCDYVVVPSGSCAGMLRKHYPALFRNTHFSEQAKQLSKKTYELTSFLVDKLKIEKLNATYAETVTYHDSCSALRELTIKEQPRKLLKFVKELEIVELAESESCCGFGGTFCVKYPEISNKMVSDKIKSIKDTKATTILSTDLGCLLNIAGKLQKENQNIKVRHLAEVLANMIDKPSIGE